MWGTSEMVAEQRFGNVRSRENKLFERVILKKLVHDAQ